MSNNLNLVKQEDPESLFESIKNVTVPAMKISMRKCSQFLTRMNSYLLNCDFSPNIIPDSTSFDKRILLLNPKISKDLNELPENTKKWILEEEKPEIIDITLHIDYNSYSQDQMFKKILPNDISTNINIISIEHIKILDLDPNQMQYKNQLAKIIYDKGQPYTTTILLKMPKTLEDTSNNTINTTNTTSTSTSSSTNHSNEDKLDKYFQEYTYEYVYGKQNAIITLKEDNEAFKVSLEDIYYDSSFQQERERLLSTFGHKNYVCDLFGDFFFMLRLAKHNYCKIIANCDDDKKYMAYTDNIQLANLMDQFDIKNMDMAEFLKLVFEKEKVKRGRQPTRSPIQHIYIGKIIKNLAFLSKKALVQSKLFIGLFNIFQNPIYDKKENLPKLHFYCLIKNSDFTESMKRVLTNKLNTMFNQNLENKLGPIIDTEDITDIFIVDSTNYHDQRLLQVSISLTPKICFWQEGLCHYILPSLLSNNPDERSKGKIQLNRPKDIQLLEKEIESISPTIRKSARRTQS